MSEWAWALVVFTAAANPARQAGRTDADGAGAAGGALLAATAVLLAWLSHPLLDGLDVSVPSAFIGVGLVAGVAGVRDLVTARPPVWEPVLSRPEVLLPAVPIGADHGTAVVAVGVVVAVALTLAARRMRTAGATAGGGHVTLSRILGGVLVVAGVDMVVDGILDV